MPMKSSSLDSEVKDQVSKKDHSKRRVKTLSTSASAVNLRINTSMLAERWKLSFSKCMMSFTISTFTSNANLKTGANV
jgi:hypothetical protein